MNPIKHWLLHNQMRVAARLNGARDLTDAHFGALVTHVVFELGGFIIKDGDNFSPVDFSVAAEKAFGKKRYADKARLDRLYGHWGAAPTYLKNASGDYEWGAMAQGLYESTLPLVRPLPRFEAWVAGLRKNYPALTGAGGWLASWRERSGWWVRCGGRVLCDGRKDGAVLGRGGRGDGPGAAVPGAGAGDARLPGEPSARDRPVRRQPLPR